MFVQVVYALCAATSLMCAVLLLRGFFSSKNRLLLWSGLCFAFLGIENVLLFIDLVVLGDAYDLRMIRLSSACVGLSLLLYGLIFDLR